MLDLVPQSGVRVADVPVGRVEEIELDEEDWTAVVTITVNGDVELPANAVAAIQQSSLLGEKYVELAPPGNEEPRGTLDDGARIPLERTNRNVEVEELLGALSLVLNGGGLAQLQTINRELGDALEGREAAIKDTLDQLDTFIGGLDEQKEEINRALDSANALAATLAARTATIEDALDTIGPGLDVINQQRDLLVSMLEGLARLGDVGTRVIDQSADNTIADLRLLQPILTQLAAAGPDLAGSLELLLTYPFPDSSLTALNYREAQTGGFALFTNMTATVDLDLTQLLCRYVDRPDGCPHRAAAAGRDHPGQVRRRGRRRRVRGHDHRLRRALDDDVVPGRPVGPERHRGPDRGADPGRRAGDRPPRPPVDRRGGAVIARSTKLKLLAFATLALLGMAYLGFKYVGLDRALLGQRVRGGRRLRATPAASSSTPRSPTAASRSAGSPTCSWWTTASASSCRIDPDADPIPADTEAVVATRSAVGEQYVDLRPSGEGEPYLEDGAVIPHGPHEHPGARRADAAQPRRVRGLDRPGEPADRRSTSWAGRSRAPATTWAG